MLQFIHIFVPKLKNGDGKGKGKVEMGIKV